MLRLVKCLIPTICLFIGPLIIFPCLVYAQNIVTIAGQGGVGYNADGVPGTIAQLNFPTSVISDTSGDIYIADQFNNRIRKVNASGVISTFAGTGALGFSGDGGPASMARLYAPYSLAINARQEIFVLDRFNQRIRKISTSGIITTFAGNGSAGFSGDGGLATAAKINNATGICLDVAGNMYVADLDNQRIRKINTSGNISTVAGTGSAGFSGDGGAATSATMNGPMGVVAVSGNIYFSDCNNNRIRKISATGVISTFSGSGSGFSGDGGPASAAHLSGPTGMSVDTLGNIFWAERDNHRIRKVDTAGIISTVAGNSNKTYNGDGIPATAAAATLFEPHGVFADRKGNILIADTWNGRLRKVDTGKYLTSLAGMGHPGYSGDGGPATAGQIFSPVGIRADRSGNVFITDKDNYRIRKRSPSGIISTYAGDGSSSAHGDGGQATAAGITLLSGIALDRKGNLYICQGAGSIRKVDTSGIITTYAGRGSGFSGDGGPATAAYMAPNGLAVDKYGNLYINDQNNYRIRKVDTTGIINTIAGTGTNGYSGDGGQATAANIQTKQIDVDTNGNIYLCEGARIRKISPSGIINTVAGNGILGFSGDGGSALTAKINAATGVAVDDAGNIYIADFENNRVRKVDVGGTISTIAGNGSYAFTGDGGPASVAGFYHPQDVATDQYGNVYISELFNHTVRMVQVCLPPVAGTIAGGTTVCVGGSASLSDSAFGGTWASSNTAVASINATTGAVYGSSPGTATIAYTLTNSCASDTALLAITVKALPNAGVITGSNRVFWGSTLMLSDTALGGIWICSDTTKATISNTGIVTPKVYDDSVTVYYIVSNECGSDTASLLVHLFTEVAVHNVNASGNARLQIYPNPNNSKCTLFLSGTCSSTIPVTIANVTGAQVQVILIQSDRPQALDLQLRPGIYLMSAELNGMVLREKLIVE